MNLSARFVAYLEDLQGLEPRTWEALQGCFRAVELKRGDAFAPLGQVTHRMGLLERGWIRATYVTPDGREYHKHLFRGPSVVGDYASLLTGEPVRVAQHALTDCHLHEADYRQLTALFDQHRDLERLARRFAEHLYLQKEQRELELVTLTAAQRYERLLARHPTIELDLLQYEIAAHLGITPTQLSRIRSARVST
ncbi:MAG: Crp/Fnr family transcriptional regulator [Myxococcales bacterium]|nr:Crp/Fnr family transcriptional regulator [Myxococcales bacterium]